MDIEIGTADGLRETDGCDESYVNSTVLAL
jgi:hypothetical protein